MTDPIDPNKLLDSIGQLPQAIEALTGVVSKLTDMFGGLFSKGVKGFEDLTKSTDKNTKANKDNVEVQQAMNDGLDQYIDKIDQANTKTEEGKRIAEDLANKGWAAMKVWTGTHIFDDFAKNTVGNFTTMSESFGQFSGNLDKLAKLAPGIFGNIGDDGLAAAQHMLDMASQGQKAEAGFYELISSAGQLNTTFKTSDDVTNKLGYSLSEYVNRMKQAAEANGTTITPVMALSKALEAIPGVMGKSVIAGQGYNNTMDDLTAAMRLATGAGRDQKDVISAVETAYANLAGGQDKQANTMQRGAELFATTYELQQKLGLSFKDSEGLLAHVAGKFKDIGDNTRGAANIMAAFGEELKKTGLTAKASSDIVSGMIDSIADMPVGNRAFLSQMSGGPGGLQGAAQIGLMEHQGKIAEVMQMAQNATRKLFHGNIVTQEEAATSQSAAAQNTQQVALLQSGIFGIGKGADENTANRILEALKSGNINLLQKSLDTGQKAVEDVAKRGNALQEKNYTKLTEIARADELISINTAAMVLGSMRTDMGTGNKEVDAALKQAKKAAMNQILHPDRATHIDEMNTAEETSKRMKKTLGNPLADVMTAAPYVFSAITNPISRAIGGGMHNDQTMNTPTIVPGQGYGAHHRAVAGAAADTVNKMEHKVKLDITVNAPPGMIGDVKADKNVSITVRGVNPGMNPEHRTNQADPGY